MICNGTKKTVTNHHHILIEANFMSYQKYTTTSKTYHDNILALYNQL